MATAKDAHTLTTYYTQIYQKHYQTKAYPNRYTARWGFDAVLMDMSVREAKELLDFYMTTPHSTHSLDWFFRNYDKLLASCEESRADAKYRAEKRAETKLRTEEWRRKRAE